MLEELLKAIRAGGTLEVAALSARLGVSPELVEAMLEHLQRSGLLENYAGCDTGCQGCSLSQVCSKAPKSDLRLWQNKPANFTH